MLDRILSNVCTFIGIALVGVALVLCLQNIQDEKIAKESSENILFFIAEIISENENVTQFVYDEEIVETPEVEPVLIDGNLYVGMLDIPELQLQLPIQSNWSYDKLKISPCIYQNYPLSIAAHNYNAHFAKIGNLSIGSEVSYIELNGNKKVYKVESVETIHGSDVDKLNDINYDLSLFTCNYSNNNLRILVRLNEIAV